MNHISGRQTIHTKVLPTTNTKGTRVKATATSGLSVTVQYGYEGLEEEHSYAMRVLCERRGWDYTKFIGGKVNEGVVWVYDDRGE